MSAAQQPETRKKRKKKNKRHGPNSNSVSCQTDADVCCVDAGGALCINDEWPWRVSGGGWSSFSGYEGGFDYIYHRNSHTSLVGVRELACSSHCLSSNAEVAEWFASIDGSFLTKEYPDRPLLFAYPAQS